LNYSNARKDFQVEIENRCIEVVVAHAIEQNQESTRLKLLVYNNR
jgi:hypothetical protein